MTDPMRIRALEQGGVTEVKVLMSHVMETGLRKDSNGKTIPAHFIQNVIVKHKDKVVLDAQFGPSVAQNPFLAFKFKGGAKGDRITVSWVDSKGERRTDEAVIA